MSPHPAAAATTTTTTPAGVAGSGTAPDRQPDSAPAHQPAAAQPGGRPACAPRRDTRAWRVQVWLAFGSAVALCGSGLAWLPGDELVRAFMVMGFVFCLSTAFGLAKFIRDNQDQAVDTPAWRAVVWAGFATAMALTAWGLLQLPVQPVWKAYLGVCWLFLMSSVFTLAKTLRDAHEADLALGGARRLPTAA